MTLREGSSCAICISSHTSSARFQSPRFPSCVRQGSSCQTRTVAASRVFAVFEDCHGRTRRHLACTTKAADADPFETHPRHPAHSALQTHHNAESAKLYLHDDGAVVGVRGGKACAVHAVQQVQRFVCLVVPFARCAGILTGVVLLENRINVQTLRRQTDVSHFAPDKR